MIGRVMFPGANPRKLARVMNKLQKLSEDFVSGGGVV